MLSLTATELQRFMACNGVISMGKIPSFNPSTEAADEGNTVHWYIEQVFNGANPEDILGKKAPSGMFVTEDMIENAQPYLNDILGKGNVEVPTSYSSPYYEIRGRADYILFEDKTLTVADFKYGHRIISPEMNWTLISHAYAWLMENNTEDVQKFVFKIYQPRGFTPDGPIRVWEVDREKFLTLIDVLSSTLTNPKKQVTTGVSQCYKCKSLSMCPAAQKAIMNAIDMSEAPFDSELDDNTLSWMLKNIEIAISLLKQSKDAYTDLALHRLKAGKAVKDFNIKANLGNKTWNKNISPEMIKSLTGVDITVSKMITPNQAIKKGLSEEMITNLTHRPERGFKLVKMDDNQMGVKMFGRKTNEK